MNAQPPQPPRMPGDGGRREGAPNNPPGRPPRRPVPPPAQGRPAPAQPAPGRPLPPPPRHPAGQQQPPPARGQHERPRHVEPPTAYAPGPVAPPPPQAWSADPPPRPGPPRPDPRWARTLPGAPDDQREPLPAVAPDGYAPRQEPEPVPGGPRPAGRRPADARGPSPAERSAGSRSRRPRDGGDGRPPAGPDQGSAKKPKKVRHRRRKRRILPWFLVILLVLVITPVGLMFYYDSKLHRTDALASYSGRPSNTPGTTWLIVGTDSRADLSQAQKDKLATGDSDGARTDTIMLAHLPPRGKPMLISIPRDLYVPIPGMGSHKINAAFNEGGPKLLVQTVENLTGLRIDHYAEIGFGGFDRLVDAVGGVTMCLDQPLHDPKAGLHLKAGCQKLNGAQALGLVRTRAFPNADLERVVNQRKFLTALMHKGSSPGVLLNPFRLFPFLNGAVDSLTVAEGDHLWNLAWLAYKLRGDTITTTVPTGGPEYTDDGDSLAVGQSTHDFFDYLRRGQSIPADLLSDTGGAVS
ncbi:LCP family protein [Gordonia sp. PP30]|uniref:LCP family protein n=1 Tax=unclassified Gordonia (in: high G+C Gram-positive bacteria) TaxID=2657482 RepID=UPI001FFEB071|nr:LCP family protein [Gordonia sp. PP30]UQE75174.1 LCP family protein [Gordonia sp. PP30]